MASWLPHGENSPQSSGNRDVVVDDDDFFPFFVAATIDVAIECPNVVADWGQPSVALLSQGFPIF